MKNSSETRRFRMTPESKELIVSMLKRGITGAEIAYDVGCSTATVTKIRKELQAQGLNYWHTNAYYFDKYPLR